MAQVHRQPVSGRPKGRGLQPRIRLALLAALGRQRHQSEGTVMGIVLLVVLGVTLAAVAIANQIGSGAIRAPLMGQSREAREAAEAGVMDVITELNKFENRRLLTANNPLEWTADQRNACLESQSGADFANSIGLTPNASPSDRALVDLSSGGEVFIGGDLARSYVLRRIQVLNPDRRDSVWADVDDEGNVTVGASGSYRADNVNISGDDLNDLRTMRVNYIRLTVEGRFYRPPGNNPVSTATTTREFQVVPKCCFRSFGPGWINAGGLEQRQDNVFGPDLRSCRDDGNNLNLGAGLGMVAFGGLNNSAGDAMSLQVDTSDPPDGVGDTDLSAVVCVGTCTPEDFEGFKNGAIPVEEREVNLREVPEPPTPRPGTATGVRAITNTLSLPDPAYCTSVPEPRDQYVSDPTLAPPSISAYDCLLDSVSLNGGNQRLRVDTGGADVRLWVEGDISIQGNAGIEHLKFGSPVNPFSDNAFFDFHLYGNRESPVQSFELRGTTNSAGYFLYAPVATCSMRGTPRQSGQFWCGGFDLRGTISILVPPTDAGGGGGDDDVTIAPLLFDYVARSTWGSRLFGRN